MLVIAGAADVGAAIMGAAASLRQRMSLSRSLRVEKHSWQRATAAAISMLGQDAFVKGVYERSQLAD